MRCALTRDGISGARMKAGGARSTVVGSLSLVATPTILFISTANGLYLSNQEELHAQISVLRPFLWLAVAALGMGVCAWTLQRFRGARPALWAYYAAGPALLLYHLTCSYAPRLQGSTIATAVCFV